MITKSLLAAVSFLAIAAAQDRRLDYMILATSKTSTMEKELNEGAAAGFRFAAGE